MWFVAAGCMRAALIIMGVLAISTVLSSLRRRIQQRPVSMLPELAGVIAFASGISWISYRSHLAMSDVFPWLLFIFGAITAIAVVVPGMFTRADLARLVRGSVVPVVFFIATFACVSHFVGSAEIPVFTVGNNDVWNYAKYAQMALHYPQGDNIVGASLHDMQPATHAPTSPLYLALMAYLTARPIIEILTPALCLIFSLSATLVYRILRDIFGTTRSVAAVLAAVWLTSGATVYLAGNYFLGQVMGTCLFLFIAYASFHPRLGERERLITLTLLFYLLYLTYYTMALPYAALCLAFGVGRTFHRFLSQRRLDLNILATAAAPFVGLALFATIHWKLFQILLGGISVLAGGAFGWPLEVIAPLNFFGPTVFPVDAGSYITKRNAHVLLFCGSLAASMVLFVRSARGKAPVAPDAVENWKNRREADLALALLVGAFAGCLLVWHVYYTRFTGPSYNQWKLATSTILALSFVPAALFWRLACLIPLRGVGVLATTLLGAALLAANVRADVVYMARSGTLTPHYGPLRSLEALDASGIYDQLRLKIDTDLTAYMIARQFVNRTPLVLLSEGHNMQDSRPASVFDLKRPVITSGCGLLDRGGAVELSDDYCLVGNLAIKNDYTVSFGTNAPNLVKILGGHGPESWGYWGGGTPETTIIMPVNPKWSSATFAFEGVPFVTSCKPAQRIRWRADDGTTGEAVLKQEGSVTFRLPASSWNNHSFVQIAFMFPDAHSPQSCGDSPDPRSLGFGFKTATVHGVHDG